MTGYTPPNSGLKAISGYSWGGALISAITSKSPIRTVESYLEPTVLLKKGDAIAHMALTDATVGLLYEKYNIWLRAVKDGKSKAAG